MKGGMSGDVTQNYECDCGGDFSANDVHRERVREGHTPSLIIPRNLLSGKITLGSPVNVCDTHPSVDWYAMISVASTDRQAFGHFKLLDL